MICHPSSAELPRGNSGNPERTFQVGRFEVSLERREDGLVRWSFSTGEGSTIEGLEPDGSLAESAARKAAIGLILQENGGLLS